MESKKTDCGGSQFCWGWISGDGPHNMWNLVAEAPSQRSWSHRFTTSYTPLWQSSRFSHCCQPRPPWKNQTRWNWLPLCSGGIKGRQHHHQEGLLHWSGCGHIYQDSPSSTSSVPCSQAGISLSKFHTILRGSITGVHIRWDQPLIILDPSSFSPPVILLFSNNGLRFTCWFVSLVPLVCLVVEYQYCFSIYAPMSVWTFLCNFYIFILVALLGHFTASYFKDSCIDVLIDYHHLHLFSICHQWSSRPSGEAAVTASMSSQS